MSALPRKYSPTLKRTRVVTRGRRERSSRPHSKAALVALLILVLETNPGVASIARGNRRDRADEDEMVSAGGSINSNHHRQMVLLQQHHHHRLHANDIGVPPSALILEPPSHHPRPHHQMGPQLPPRISQTVHHTAGPLTASGHLSYFPSPPDSPRLLRLLGEEEDGGGDEEEEAERAEAEAAAAEGRAPRWMMFVEPPPPPISLRPLFDQVTNARWRQAPPQPPPIPPPRHYYQHPRPPQGGGSSAAAAAASAQPRGTSFSSTFSSSSPSLFSSTSFSSSAAATFPSSSTAASASTFSASSRLLPPWSKRGSSSAEQQLRGGGHRASPSAGQHSSRSHGGSRNVEGVGSGEGEEPGNQLLVRQQRGGRQYDVPQIECPPAEDGMERFACPTPDRMGRYRCIDDHVLCDGFIDCPNGEDEDRQACMFYKTTKAHLDVLADALLRWARGR